MSNQTTPIMGNVRKPVKITVLKKMCTSDIYSEKPEGVVADAEPVCGKFEVGQSFIVDKTGDKPADFPCEWAWMDLYSIIMGMQMGGNFIRFRHGLQYVCCTDGLRPVFFKIERLED